MKIMKKKSATKNKKSYNINVQNNIKKKKLNKLLYQTKNKKTNIFIYKRKKIKEADFYKIEGFSYKKIKNCVYHFYKVQFINYKYTAIYKTFK
ncbi:hypothetical protein PFBG_04221 [Plasmodium falciparum 7G8]|uniref:Uncharacterized protein n=1 Tax=Plasmodium falciparum (isolate 7G8) TaxID=57266 RepID=W7F8I4_PLAF8|nr:hypothetical protein PFBG_04221 [Plasmodium falciparum 7G8]